MLHLSLDRGPLFPKRNAEGLESFEERGATHPQRMSGPLGVPVVCFKHREYSLFERTWTNWKCGSPYRLRHAMSDRFGENLGRQLERRG
jgi:hypothetical protein